MHSTENLRGILAMLLAVAVFSGMDAQLKLLAGHYGPMQVAFLRGVSETDLDRVVDERWDPPVTLGVRLVSVADDCAQHAGQAAYVKGLLRG